VLQFLITEINYGGRVTDDKDRRLISNLITSFCAPPMLTVNHPFSPSGAYTTPDCLTARDYLEHIRQYPLAPKPEIFGLHDNADITCDQNETYDLCATCLSLQPRVAAGVGRSREEIISELADTILSQVGPTTQQRLQPGACGTLAGPCDGAWADVDSCETPQIMYLHVQQRVD
jgi:dynein heavy chain, axonemal